MSIYLTSAGSLHAVLRKNRVFDESKPLESNSTRLTDAARGSPVTIRRELSTPPMDGIPSAPTMIPDTPPEEENPLFLPGPGTADESDDEFVPQEGRDNRARDKGTTIVVSDGEEGGAEPQDDKKKLRFHTEYEGFTIYDKVLCLVVTRTKDNQKAKAIGDDGRGGLIEGWIRMSQAVRDREGDDE